jgi:hypothetical protein
MNFVGRNENWRNEDDRLTRYQILEVGTDGL